MILSALALTATALATAAPAGAVSLGPPEPHSPNAETIDTAYWVMIAIAITLLVAFHIALFAAIGGHRAGRGRRPVRFVAGRGALRPVAAALGLVAAAVLAFGIVTTADVRQVEPTGPDGLAATTTAQVGVQGAPPAPVFELGEAGAEEAQPLEINAIAQQWLWRFEYPGGEAGRRTFSYGELVVPVDTAVVLNIDSVDVVHSWWVPSLGGQVQAVPGEITRTWFKADEEGVYPGRSTVYSGSGYPTMRAWVRAVSPTDYQAYVEELQADLSEAQTIVQDAVSEEPTE